MKERDVNLFFEELEEDLDFRAHVALADLADTLAGQIQEMREAKGLSQRDLARLLGTQQSQISRMEDPAYARYTMLTLAKLADVLGGKLAVSLQPEAVSVNRADYSMAYFLESATSQPTANAESNVIHTRFHYTDRAA